MAITRAQQAKQMLQDGGRIGFFTGMREAEQRAAQREKAASNRESRRTSQYNAPSKQSTYSSDIEDEIVTRGDTTDRNETLSNTPKFMPSGGEQKTKKELKDIRDKERKNYQDQFLSKGKVPPGPNRKARQRALNYINKNMLINYNRFTNPPTRMLSPTGYPNYGIPSFYQGFQEALAAGKTLEEILEEGNMIPVGSMTDPNRKSYELNPIPDLDIDSIRELASVQTTMQGTPLTGYQADALKKIRENIVKRDNFIDTGDTSNVFPDPPTPTLDNDDPVVLDPCKGPNPPAYCFTKTKEEEDTTPKRNLGGLSARIGGSLFDFDQFAADGGRIGVMDGGMMEDTPEGGIMDLESGRQMYFLGKLVKKASRAVKKITESPLGKLALTAAVSKFGGGFGLGGIKRGLFGITAKGQALRGFPELAAKKGLFAKLGLTGGYGSIMPTVKGGITLASILSGLTAEKEDEGNDALAKYLAENQLDLNAPLNTRIAGSDFYQVAADGGRIGYQEGGDAEPVAKKTMPLLDMGGKEKDYRETGGFVDMGRMEKADDVPARLSKNEFVFTADAVRNAGDGNVDKGAEVMYNMMKNLESGGEVSEESQGLEGAREMFQTSQRLGEVI
jgi:hypothetical protein